MIRSHRQRFNREYSDAKYQRFLQLLEQCCGGKPDFRHSETPCFFPARLIDDMARYGREMTEQLVADPAYLAASTAAIPDAWRAPNEDPVPLFVQADFGLDEALEPKLVEIQGFPSLYAYQTLMAESYREAYGLPSDLDALPGGLRMDEYRALLGRAIVGDQDPENVVLLEIDPAHQKTRHDFVVTEKFFGVRTVDILAVRQDGDRLFYERDGKRVPIRRIYNRVIVDDLERRGISIPFDFRDQLQVEWAGHPNWFFRLSKFSLPYLKHPAVPRTYFLSELGTIENPEQYVLKPLYSFAGVGVVVGPTAEQIAAIPTERRRNYILQERVNFEPVIDTPYGMTKVEVRIMYIWLDELRPVNILIRMGRGAQMGVDHNKGLAWVGASAGFIDNNTP